MAPGRRLIGRDFDAGLLERILSVDEDGFLNALDAALEAGLVTTRRRNPSATASPTRSSARRCTTACRWRAGRGPTGASARRWRPRNSAALPTGRSRCTSPAPRAPRTLRRRSSTRCAPASRRRRCSPTRRRPSTTPGRSRRSSGSTRMPTPVRCELLIRVGEAHVRAGERPLAWETASARPPRSRSGSARAPQSARAAIGASRRHIQAPGHRRPMS